MKISELKECQFTAKCEKDIGCSFCDNTIKAGTHFCLHRYVSQTFHDLVFYRTEYTCPECFIKFRDMEFLDIPAYIYGSSIPEGYVTFS